jgi:hypothetical protein
METPRQSHSVGQLLLAGAPQDVCQGPIGASFGPSEGSIWGPLRGRNRGENRGENPTEKRVENAWKTGGKRGGNTTEKAPETGLERGAFWGVSGETCRVVEARVKARNGGIWHLSRHPHASLRTLTHTDNSYTQDRREERERRETGVRPGAERRGDSRKAAGRLHSQARSSPWGGMVEPGGMALSPCVIRHLGETGAPPPPTGGMAAYPDRTAA